MACSRALDLLSQLADNRIAALGDNQRKVDTVVVFAIPAAPTDVLLVVTVKRDTCVTGHAARRCIGIV